MWRDTMNHTLLGTLILTVSMMTTSISFANHGAGSNIGNSGARPGNFNNPNCINHNNYQHNAGPNNYSQDKGAALILSNPVPIIYYPDGGGCHPIQKCDAYGNCIQDQDCY